MEVGRAPPVPGHPQRRPHPRGGGGRRPARPPSRSSCAAAASAGPCASRSTPTVTDEVLELLQRELDLADDDVYVVHRPARPRRAVVAARPRPARPEGRALGRAVTQPRLASRRRARCDIFRRPAPGRRARAPPVRLVRQRRSRSSSARRRDDPQGPRHQAHALPHRRRQPRSSTSLIRAAERGQAGGGARRAEGPLRRAGQHRAGPDALEKAGVHVVYGLVGPEDPHQDHARRPRGGRRHPPLLPHRHRQLQPEDRPALRGPRPAHRRPRDRRRPHPAVQPPHRLRPRHRLPASCWCAPDSLRTGIRRPHPPEIEAGPGRRPDPA